MAMAPSLQLYETFCSHFDEANILLNETERLTNKSSKIGRATPSHTSSNSAALQISKTTAKKLAHFLKQAKLHPDHSQLSLQSFLILPIQRLARYKLLLNQVVSNTPGDHPDWFSCAKAEKDIETRIIACNEKKRERDELGDRERLLSKISVPWNASQAQILKAMAVGKKLIFHGAVRVLRIVESRNHGKQTMSFDPLFACDGRRNRFIQHSVLQLLETRFVSDLMPLPESVPMLNQGQVFQFYIFQHLIFWCKKPRDLAGKHELISALHFGDDVEWVMDPALDGQPPWILRISCQKCILYIESQDLLRRAFAPSS